MFKVEAVVIGAGVIGLAISRALAHPRHSGSCFRKGRRCWSRHLIATGLDAWDFSARLGGLDRGTIPPKFLAKGNYFTLAGIKAPFHHLVYPMPEPGGLGVHLTLDLAGQARFGPDVEWVDRVDYAVDPDRGSMMQSAVTGRIFPTVHW